MTDTPSVQSGESPESPQNPDLDTLPVEERLRLLEEQVCRQEDRFDDALRLLREVHTMSTEAYQLMNSPGIAAMRKFQGFGRRPLAGGGRG